MSSFNVIGLETIQLVSLRPDRVRIVYAGREDLDEPIRQQFQRRLDRDGAATTFDVQRAPAIPADPRTGKHRLVAIQG